MIAREKCDKIIKIKCTLPKGKRLMKNKKRLFRILVAVLLAVFLIFAVAFFAINQTVVNVGGEMIVGADQASGAIDADCILILGAGVRNDGTPSDMLADRLNVGIELYNSGAAPKILVSGDNSRVDYNEPEVMKLYCVENGVPEEDIVLDYAGFSTYESLFRARDVFCAENIIIVTQEYHLYRALYVAEKLGLGAVGVSADLRTYRGQSYRDLRETAARNKDFLFAIFMPEPTYLGEQIPIK